MTTQQNALCDTEILSMIEKNNTQGWKSLYDKYALMMYTTILWVIQDETLTEGVLILLFAQLRTNKPLLETKKSLSASLLHHAYRTAVKISRTKEIIPKKADSYKEIFPTLNGFIYKPHSVKKFSEIHVLNDEPVKLRLRAALN